MKLTCQASCQPHRHEHNDFQDLIGHWLREVFRGHKKGLKVFAPWLSFSGRSIDNFFCLYSLNSVTRRVARFIPNNSLKEFHTHLCFKYFTILRHLGQIGNKELRKNIGVTDDSFRILILVSVSANPIKHRAAGFGPELFSENEKNNFFRVRSKKILLRSRRILKCSAFRIKRSVVSFVF